MYMTQVCATSFITEEQKEEEEGEKGEEAKEEEKENQSLTVWSVVLTLLLGTIWVLCEAASAICVQLLEGAVPDWELNFIR